MNPTISHLNQPWLTMANHGDHHFAMAGHAPVARRGAGAQGERMRATSVWAAHALRASGSYLLSLAGDEPPEARTMEVDYMH